MWLSEFSCCEKLGKKIRKCVKNFYNYLGIDDCIKDCYKWFFPEELVILTAEQKKFKIENWMK